MNPTLIDEQSGSAMGCEHCHGIMMNGSSRTVLDDSGSLAITAWRCSSCDGVIEEIQILSRYGRPNHVAFGMQCQKTNYVPASHLVFEAERSTRGRMHRRSLKRGQI